MIEYLNIDYKKSTLLNWFGENPKEILDEWINELEIIIYKDMLATQVIKHLTYKNIT